MVQESACRTTSGESTSGVVDASSRGDLFKGVLVHQRRVMQKMGVAVLLTVDA